MYLDNTGIRLWFNYLILRSTFVNSSSKSSALGVVQGLLAELYGFAIDVRDMFL